MNTLQLRLMRPVHVVAFLRLLTLSCRHLQLQIKRASSSTLGCTRRCSVSTRFPCRFMMFHVLRVLLCWLFCFLCSTSLVSFTGSYRISQDLSNDKLLSGKPSKCLYTQLYARWPLSAFKNSCSKECQWTWDNVKEYRSMTVQQVSQNQLKRSLRACSVLRHPNLLLLVGVHNWNVICGHCH